MAQTLRIENSTNSIETIFDDRDFEDLLDKYLGYEVARYYSERIRELEGEIEELKEENETLTSDLEDLREELRTDEDDFK
jgi:predicted  nucleic acid-binding Zn-ribbon protein